MIKKITNYKSQTAKGVTVVELLIYLALLAIFLTVLLDVFITTLNFKLASESVSALNQDTRYILAKLSYEIYNADTVGIPANFGDTASLLEITKGGMLYTYTVNSGDLILTSGGVSAKLNGNDTQVQSISFKRLGSSGGCPTIQVNLNMQSRIITKGNVQKIQSVGSTFQPRCKIT